MSLPEHIGTHMDAPSHIRLAPGGLKLSEIPIENFIGDAVVIDIREKAFNNPDAVLTVQDILRWENKYGRIKDGSIVFMYSGWQKFYNNATQFVFGDPNDPENWHFPGFGEDAAMWLTHNRKISGIGVDSISIDPGNSVTLKVHTTVLGSGLYGIEMVKNLGLIPASGAKIIALPMKIRNGSGGPVRLVSMFTGQYILF